MKTQCSSNTNRGLFRRVDASLRKALIVSVLGAAAACTTTQTEPVGLQDVAFSRMTYDRELDQTDVIMRSLDENSDESSLKNALDKEIYLPLTMTRSLRKKADQARANVKNMATADAESLRILSVEALTTGQPEMVEGYLRYSKSARKRTSMAAEVQLLLGLASLMLGDESKARSLLSEAAQFPGTSVTARCNLGLLALRRGAHLEALELFRQAEQLDPGNSRIGHMAAETAYNARKYSAAIDAYKKIIARDKNDMLAHYNLGLVYLYGNRSFKDAKRHFRIVMDHPKASQELRAFADAAFVNVRREEESAYGLATADVKSER
ncbi:MAG: tetratricopeptide repeat protein [Betaproteobacteria bacterium]|nr:tetratricopeptide repeat protein [Betaproteobacteria bacterium]